MGVLGFDRPLGERLSETNDIAGEDGFLRASLLWMLAGVDYEWSVGAIRVVQHAHSVAEAGRDVQLEERGPAAGPRVPVGDAGRDAFVERQDVFELGVVLKGVHERLLSRAGIAEDVAGALGEQLLEHGVASGESRHGERIACNRRRAIVKGKRRLVVYWRARV